MRCEICNSYSTGGAVSGVCDDCSTIIQVVAEGATGRVEKSYSVIPSPTDAYGRVILCDKHNKNYI